MTGKVVNATEFKAKCLAILDDVEERGDTIIVTRRGHPIAKVLPLSKKRWKSPRWTWAGKVEIVGDIVNFDTTDLWDALRNRAEESE